MMREQTILLLGPSRDAVSGVSTHLNQLFSSSLASQVRLIHFQVGSEGRKESKPGKLLRLVASPLQLMGAIFRARAQIVHINTSMEAKAYWRDLAYLLVAKLLRRRVVYQVHGGALPQDFFAGKPLLAALLHRVLRLPDLIVLLAQQELQAYRAFDPALPLSVIANAIDLPPDPADKMTATAGPLSLAYVGRLAAEKGLFELVEAAAEVVRAGRLLTVTVAGGGPDEAALRERVTRLGLDGHVNFVGPVFGEQKTALLNNADVFGFPTRHREGLPYALLESMAARTPVVICPVGAIPDVMQDGVHGIFVPPGDVGALRDAILRLDQDRALLRRMGKACRERVQAHYSLDRLSADFQAVYARWR